MHSFEVHSNESACRKSGCLGLEQVKCNAEGKLIFSTNDLHVIKWYFNTDFAMYADLKSHTDVIMTYGRVVTIYQLRKQKLNTRISTKSGPVGADDMYTIMFWTKLFIEAQVFEN